MARRTNAPLRARLSQFGRDLAHFLMVRLVLIGAGAVVGALIGVAFIPAGYGLIALAAGALFGAVVTLFISIPAVGGKASVREAGEDILGFLLMFVLACAASAAVGTVIGLLLVPWQGWGVVGVAAAIGAVAPLVLLFMGLGGGTDPEDEFRGFLRDVVGGVSAFSRGWRKRRKPAVCPYCGQKQTRGPDGTSSVCPHCGFGLRRDDYPVCRWCGEKHTFGPDGTDRECDNCGGFRGDAYEICPWCDEKHTFGPWGTSPVCSNCGLFREGV